MLDGITRERELLRDLRSNADILIDTSGLNVHQLSAKVQELVGDKGGPDLRIAVMSFGFKYGIPLDAGPLRLEAPLVPLPSGRIRSGPRTGVSGAGGTDDYPWRFWIDGDGVARGFLNKNLGLAEIVVPPCFGLWVGLD